MILKRSTTYWSTGISLHWQECAQRNQDGSRHPGWGGTLDFLDDGFTDDDADAGQVSTQGTLRTRYAVIDGDAVSGLRAVMETLIADAARLGIEFRSAADRRPMLMYRGDGEDENYPAPEGWRELLAAEAERINWVAPYGVNV